MKVHVAGGKMFFFIGTREKRTDRFGKLRVWISQTVQELRTVSKRGVEGVQSK
jgi:hypothetical protein